MSSLVKYEAARYALQQAVSIDDVKTIRDKAAALSEYARQAQDTTLLDLVSALKVRAERKVGELLAEMEMNVGAKGNAGGQGAKLVRSHGGTTQNTLKDIGINKNQSSRWQQLASIPPDKFEAFVEARMSSSKMLSMVNPPAPKPTVIPAVAEDGEVLEDYTETEFLLDQERAYSTGLRERVHELEDQIATGNLPKDEVVDAITSLQASRKRIDYLEQMAAVMETNRNTAMNEAASMKQQMLTNERRIKAVEKKYAELEQKYSILEKWCHELEHRLAQDLQHLNSDTTAVRYGKEPDTAMLI